MDDRSEKILGVYYDGGSYPALEVWSRAGASLPKKLARKLTALATYQRNARSSAYMEMLLRARFSGMVSVAQIGPDRVLPPLNWSDHTKLVLLWPDANGMGWRSIESQVRAARHPSVEVLNGRNRGFPLDSAIHRKLRLRRVIEKSQLPKILFCACFLAVTPCLWLADVLRGRR